MYNFTWFGLSKNMIVYANCSPTQYKGDSRIRFQFQTCEDDLNCLIISPGMLIRRKSTENAYETFFFNAIQSNQIFRLFLFWFLLLAMKVWNSQYEIENEHESFALTCQNIGAIQRGQACSICFQTRQMSRDCEWMMMMMVAFIHLNKCIGRKVGNFTGQIMLY